MAEADRTRPLAPQRRPKPSYTQLSKKLVPSLSSFEIAIYTAAWAAGVLYSVFIVYRLSKRLHRRLFQQDFEMSWYFETLWRKDISDHEWMVFSEVIFSSLPWLGIHFVGSQWLKKNNKQMLPKFFFLLSAIYVCKLATTVGFAYLCLQPLVFFFVALLTKSSLCCYMVSLFFMLAKEMESGPVRALHHHLLPPEGDLYRPSYVASVSYAWINSRCLSFCLDMIWEEVPASRSKLDDLVNLLSYCFYIPSVMTGPLVNYKEYYNGLQSDYVPLSFDRIKSLSLTFLRYLIWLFINHGALHLLYFNALQYDLDILNEVDLWGVIGIAFCMGQFFQMKYNVYYGMPRAFLMADNIEMPVHTRCICRIALYSDMWKYFDNGLYKFIHKYYFTPCVNFLGDANNAGIRLLASFITFCYIFLWHGLADYVFIWSSLNFLGVTLEASAKWCASTAWYQYIEKTYMSPHWRRRFYCMLAAPLCMMSILSQFFFLMGKDAGQIVFWRAYTSWPIGTPATLFFAFCCSQFSFEMRNWDIRNLLLSSKIN